MYIQYVNIKYVSDYFYTVVYNVALFKVTFQFDQKLMVGIKMVKQIAIYRFLHPNYFAPAVSRSFMIAKQNMH